MPGVKRIELVVVAGVVVSLPSITEAFNGGITVATALVRLALGLLVCGAVGAIVERTIDTYAREARQKEIERRVSEAISSRQAYWSRGVDGREGPPPSV
ncbi:MAG: hypothetical protein M0Z33_08200 [Actinomycetota bacterium]|nr:hypothetical protein [Actinomycetota bacterium]